MPYEEYNPTAAKFSIIALIVFFGVLVWAITHTNNRVVTIDLSEYCDCPCNKATTE